jgi:AAA+ superfamily predicted ATPase
MSEPDKSDKPDVKARKSLPDGAPAWARELGELYYSGTTSAFVVTGNVVDFVRQGPGRWSSVAEFLAEQVFGRWDLVIHYDLARGLRCLAGSDSKRLQEMVATANRLVGDLRALPRDPQRALAALDLLVQKTVMAEPADRVRTAVIIDHAGFVAPRGDRLSLGDQTQVVTLLNWAASPYVKRLNLAFVLIEGRGADVSDRLTSSPHVATIEVPLPDEAERRTYLEDALAGKDIAAFSAYTIPQLASLTAGIGLVDLDVLVRTASEGARPLDAELFRDLKKRLIERQAQDLLEFVQPKWGLDTVVGHEGAKRRLLDDADLIKRGRLDTVPMGYLVCGPVGTGKTFLAQCVAGSLGIPAVVLKNFRSKYVGETEGNLERVLGVLRSMGPVVVIVDEADTMLGNRGDGDGDGGVSSRVFGQIAAQMGDTRYRGKIIWMLLTARPDLLPIDLKRQGRAEIHVPLFYPTEDAELRHMFKVLAKKLGATLLDEDIPAELPHKGDLSGADVEGILGRAYRVSLLAGSERITRDALAGALAGFLPSTQTLERELQELAAILECTDLDFLPPAKRTRLDQLGGRDRVQERVSAIKQLIERM